MQSQPLRESFRIHTLYFFQIVKDQTASVQKTDIKVSNLDIASHITGGGRRDRTDDLLLAKQALSQLSYAPSSFDNRRIRVSAAVSIDGGSGWVRTNDPRLIKTML